MQQHIDELVTADALKAIGATDIRAQHWRAHIVDACVMYDISTPVRIAAFLAQVGHESGGLKYVAEVWGPTAAQLTYEGRKSLGNTQTGDGERYKGHGLIQTTGRYNHARVRDRLRSRIGADVPDFEAEPEQLMIPRWAALSAADYWDDRGLNAIADAGNFELITRRINGGLNGHQDRTARWEKVKAVLLTSPPVAVPAPVATTETIAPLPPPTPTPTPPPFATVGGEFSADVPQQQQPDHQTTTAQTQPQEQPVTPFLAAVLPSLIDLVPKLGTVFASGSAVSERNIKAAQLIADAAKTAVGASNEQELAQRIATDPEAARKAKSAIEQSWYQLTEIGGGVEAARKYNATPDAPKFWLQPAFWVTLLLLPLVYGTAYQVLTTADFSAEVKSMVVATIISGILGSVAGYWLGSSFGSSKKTDLISK